MYMYILVSGYVFFQNDSFIFLSKKMEWGKNNYTSTYMNIESTSSLNQTVHNCFSMP